MRVRERERESVYNVWRALSLNLQQENALAYMDNNIIIEHHIYGYGISYMHCVNSIVPVKDPLLTLTLCPTPILYQS